MLSASSKGDNLFSSLAPEKKRSHFYYQSQGLNTQPIDDQGGDRDMSLELDDVKEIPCATSKPTSRFQKSASLID